MATKISNIKKGADTIYPITKVECVYDDNNNNVNDLLLLRANKDLSNVTQPTINNVGTYTGNDRVIETYISSDGNTWYRKWASGWKQYRAKVTTSVTRDFRTTHTIPNSVGFTNVNSMLPVMSACNNTSSTTVTIYSGYIRVDSTTQITARAYGFGGSDTMNQIEIYVEGY